MIRNTIRAHIPGCAAGLAAHRPKREEALGDAQADMHSGPDRRQQLDVGSVNVVVVEDRFNQRCRHA